MPEGMTTIQEQIAQLEKEIQEKRASLEPQAPNSETTSSDKEMLRQVIGEKIQQQQPASSGAAPVVPKSAPSGQNISSDDQPSYATPALQDQVQKLVNTAFSQGIDDAIHQAVASNNAALIDAFHDVLVDQLYNELLMRKKIEPPNE